MLLRKGLLVVFEGIDGAGKSTQTHMLFEYLKNKGLKVVLSREPTDSIYGQRIRDLAQNARDSISPLEEYRLFVDDRKIHVKNVINPALKSLSIVILDRYYFSNMAYQGAIGLDPNEIRSENEAFSPIPDIVFIFNIQPVQGIERIEKSRKEKPNLFEKEENLKRAAKIFDSLKDRFITRVNGAENVDSIHNQVKEKVDELIDSHLKKQS